MTDTFHVQEDWILPDSGTWGTKAQNLWNNRDIIHGCGLDIPKSMVIPHEFFHREGGIFYLLDAITEHFPDSPRVFVRSSSPDEDLETRTPGLYTSAEIEHRERVDSLNSIAAVQSSYWSRMAKERRARSGIPETGMSLLVQEAIPAMYAGWFSDIGEIAILGFADATKGAACMMHPPLSKNKVNLEGRIVGQTRHVSFHEHLAERLRRLASRLPKLDGRGWEIEFIANERGLYAVQTTPIEKKPRFEVKPSGHNIFRPLSDAILGTGEVQTQDILYVPYAIKVVGTDAIREFDATHTNYALASTHLNFKPGGNILDHTPNATAIFDLTSGFWARHPFAPHVEQHMREGRVALGGEFIGRFGHIMLGDDKGIIKYVSDIMHSPTRLKIQCDEVEQRSHVQVLGGYKPFSVSDASEFRV